MATAAIIALGAVFVAAAVSKFVAWESWRAQSADMGVPWTIAASVPAVELVIGALGVATIARQQVAIAALIVLVAFTTLLVIRLAQGRRPPCACFGALRPTPIGWGHVARNAVFAALAVVAISG